ncbi:DnaJ domain-containing protein [Candidatus Poribacteria bacterium]|nr:DnaJ domain-containing protein [Candidatus Poribacteria bacterium]
MKNDSHISALWPPAVVALIILYILSPVDLVPGVFVGWVDDLLSGILLVWFLTSWLPRNRHRIYGRRSASQSADADGDWRASGEGEAAAQGGKPEFDPFQILNIRRGASLNDIKHAYREMLMKYHPDRVAHLGSEFQQLAHNKVIEIRKAYETLCGKG